MQSCQSKAMTNTLINPRELRSNLRKTLVQLSASTDVSIPTLNTFELGKLHTATDRTIKKLAKAYGVTIADVEAYIESTKKSR